MQGTTRYNGKIAGRGPEAQDSSGLLSAHYRPKPNGTQTTKVQKDERGKEGRNRKKEQSPRKPQTTANAISFHLHNHQRRGGNELDGNSYSYFFWQPWSGMPRGE